MHTLLPEELLLLIRTPAIKVEAGIVTKHEKMETDDAAINTKSGTFLAELKNKLEDVLKISILNNNDEIQSMCAHTFS